MGNEWDAMRERDLKDRSLPEPATPDYEDVYKSAVGGLGRAATGIVGLPGDIQHGTEALIDYGLGKAGLPPVNAQRRAQAGTRLPTSAEIQQAVEPYTGKFYEPQTDLGKITSRAVEFAPGAMVPGAGMAASTARMVPSSIPGLSVRIANSQIPRAIAARTANTIGGAAGSVVGENLTADTPYQPIGQAIGALAGGYAGARAVSPMHVAPRLGEGAKALAGVVGSGLGHQIGGYPGAIAGASVPYIADKVLQSTPVRGYLSNRLVPQTPRDILTQAVAQQAFRQPSMLERQIEDEDR